MKPEVTGRARHHLQHETCWENVGQLGNGQFLFNIEMKP